MGQSNFHELSIRILSSQVLSCITDTTDLSLRRLNLSGNDLSLVSPLLLSQAVLRLHQVLLLNTHLTVQQASQVLDTIGDGFQSPLTSLYISDNNLGRGSFD